MKSHTDIADTSKNKRLEKSYFSQVVDVNSRKQGIFWLVLFYLCQSSWFMLETNPCVNSVPQNPNSQRSVAPGQQRVIYLMVNESLILCKRQVRVARAPADREIFAAWAFSQKVWAVPQAGDKVKEITFDLLWHSYNYLDPGEGPFLWLGYCHLIFHLKDVKAISQLVV